MRRDARRKARARGRLQEAQAAFERAHQLDPQSPTITLGCGLPFFYEGKYAAALDWFHHGLKLEPKSALGHRLAGNAYVLSRDCNRGLKELEYSRQLSPNHTHAIADLGYGYAVCGQPAEARQLRAHLETLVGRRYVTPYDFALIDAGLNDRGRTLLELEQARVQRVTGLPYLFVEPRFAPLRSEPRFRNLVRSVLGEM